jgi:hypothetical protein
MGWGVKEAEGLDPDIRELGSPGCLCCLTFFLETSGKTGKHIFLLVKHPGHFLNEKLSWEEAGWCNVPLHPHLGCKVQEVVSFFFFSFNTGD